MALNDLKLGVAGSEALLSIFARTFSEGYLERAREERTASGRLVKDIIAIKTTWSIKYDYIADADLAVIRVLYNLCAELSFLVTRPSAAVDSYTVILKPFTWDRAPGYGMKYWEGVSIDMEEV